ncbi:MAG TPA: NmrA family NAD(P)-binding protein [Candidatus Limnocylindrales bacterium]|nr:NmrA family NAD(P)-binding protein [Candidatus Limnocylindrales bacterium]
MTGPVLVTGAPGNVGTPLVLELLRLGASVRVAALDVAAARTVFGDEVEVVPFDFADPTTSGVFDGVERMFLLRPPAIADVDGVMVPALRAAAERGVRHVVFLSIQGAERNRIVPHRKIEDRLRTSGMAWTFVRAAYFMQNLSTTHAPEIREIDEIWVPAGRTSRTAHVDARDVAAVAARALVEDGHEGMAYTPTGPAALTYDEIATILSAELGRPIRYADPGLPAFWRRLRHRGLPRAMVGVMLGIYTAARLGLAAGITDDVQRITGRPPIAFAAFAHDSRAAWLLPG